MCSQGHYAEDEFRRLDHTNVSSVRFRQDRKGDVGLVLMLSDHRAVSSVDILVSGPSTWVNNATSLI